MSRFYTIAFGVMYYFSSFYASVPGCHGSASIGLTGSQRERLDQISQYFHHNQARLHYEQYLAAGYPIASGVIASACRQVIQDRLERTGMHWTVSGAQALLQLRCVALNGDWEAFMNDSIEQEGKRLYPHAHWVEQAEWSLLKAA